MVPMFFSLLLFLSGFPRRLLRMRSAGMFCRFTFPRAMFQGCICAALRIQWHPPKNANAHAALARAIEIQPPWYRPGAGTPSARASSTASPADGTHSPARSSAPSWGPSPSNSTEAKTMLRRASKSRPATRENSANGQQLNLDPQAPSTVLETCASLVLSILPSLCASHCSEYDQSMLFVQFVHPKLSDSAQNCSAAANFIGRTVALVGSPSSFPNKNRC